MSAKTRSRVRQFSSCSTYQKNNIWPPPYRNIERLTQFIDEELIKYGWDQDVWFHVDNLSSAHIYVRLPDGETWDKISEPLLIDCAQLTKANSIEGEQLNVILSMIEQTLPSRFVSRPRHIANASQVTRRTTSQSSTPRGPI